MLAHMKLLSFIPTVLRTILVTDQLNAPTVLIIRRSKLYHTASGIITLKQVSGLKLLKYNSIEHIVVKLGMNSSDVITVYLFTISMLCHVEVTFIHLLNLLKRYYVYLHFILLSLMMSTVVLETCRGV